MTRIIKYDGKEPRTIKTGEYNYLKNLLAKYAAKKGYTATTVKKCEWEVDDTTIYIAPRFSLWVQAPITD